MESRLEWISDEEGILTVSEGQKEKLRFLVYIITDGEAELKLDRAEITELEDGISEAFLRMWNEGFEYPVLVESYGTEIDKILRSTSVVELEYSEYMMRCQWRRNPESEHSLSGLVLLQEADTTLYKNREGSFSCRLIPYPEENKLSYYLYEVEVDESKRNRGIASGCLTELFQRLTQEEDAVIYLQVGSYNAPAVHLYKKLGFVVHEELCYYTAKEGSMSWREKNQH